jgi:NTE family protein
MLNTTPPSVYCKIADPWPTARGILKFMHRRQFLTILAASLLAAGCEPGPPGKRIGLALGGGGARGLAHIPMLEVFDELGIRPHRIAGCSIGAVIGSLYAAGLSGQQIRHHIDRLTVSKDESWLNSLFNEDITRWLEFIQLRLGHGGLMESDDLMTFLRELMHVNRFDELQIPMRIVATDFWKREQVVMNRGDLFTAIKASMAIPGLFNPVERNGRYLVDGGLVNPVPYDLLFRDCDVIVAIDVLGYHTPDTNDSPDYLETTFYSFQIMQAAIMQEKLRYRKPDIYIKPEINDIQVLEFYKADEIFEQAAPASHQLHRKLWWYSV